MGSDSKEGLVDGRPQPSKEENPSKMVKISSRPYEVTKWRLTNLLQENADLFIWTATNVSDIDSEVISHHLRVHSTCLPVKQKKWSFVQERQETITKKVDKLLKANSIWEIMYPDKPTHRNS